jgi:protein involved in polysaccharide export with SLBB domain
VDRLLLRPFSLCSACCRLAFGLTFYIRLYPLAAPTAHSTWLRRLLLSLPLLVLFSSCVPTRYYNQRTLFRLTDEKGNRIDTAKLRVAVNRTDRNYRIQPNDFLDVRVYTNKGERIIDPNGELGAGAPAGQTPGLSARATRGATRTGGGGGGTGLELLVQANGMVALPVIGQARLSGLSLRQADSTLQVLYSTYYVDPYVQARVTNNRVIVFSSPGGVVVPLANDNMNLLEVLALAGGVDAAGSNGGGGLYRFGGNMSNIRIIRGDLKNPQVEQIDLSTIAGMRRANLQMEPNDIVYVEPVRRRFLEGLSDTSPVFAAFGTLLGTVSVVISLIVLSRSQ